ncbi:MAG: peptide deformylase [Pseudomonadota bacterium]
MAVREILIVPDPVLREVSNPIDGVDGAARTLMDDMLETMYDAKGIGLAAIQIGVPKRVIVMDLAGEDEEPQPKFFVNPVLSDFSEEKGVYQEGCLSIPGHYDDVERPVSCTVDYLDYEGNEVQENAEGLFATCIQHELDHLNGVIFLDHLSRLKRDRILKKLKKEQRMATAS